jgi:hypothetical protein
LLTEEDGERQRSIDKEARAADCVCLEQLSQALTDGTGKGARFAISCDGLTAGRRGGHEGEELRGDAAFSDVSPYIVAAIATDIQTQY